MLRNWYSLVKQANLLTLMFRRLINHPASKNQPSTRVDCACACMYLCAKTLQRTGCMPTWESMGGVLVFNKVSLVSSVPDATVVAKMQCLHLPCTWWIAGQSGNPWNGYVVQYFWWGDLHKFLLLFSGEAVICRVQLQEGCGPEHRSQQGACPSRLVFLFVLFQNSNYKVEFKYSILNLTL